MNTPKWPYKWLKNILKNLEEKNEDLLQNLDTKISTHEESKEHTQTEKKDNKQHTTSDDTSKESASDIQWHTFFWNLMSDTWIENNLYLSKKLLQDKDWSKEHTTMKKNTEERNTVAVYLGTFFVNKFNGDPENSSPTHLKNFLDMIDHILPDSDIKEKFRETILSSNLSYEIIAGIYHTTQSDNMLLSNGEIRNMFKDKDSPFRLECMLAYLQKNEPVIKKIEYIVATALKVKHTDGTNSSTFIESAEDIVQNTMAQSYDIPRQFIQRTTKNQNKVQNRINEDLQRESDEFFDMLK